MKQLIIGIALGILITAGSTWAGNYWEQYNRDQQEQTERFNQGVERDQLRNNLILEWQRRQQNPC